MQNLESLIFLVKTAPGSLEIYRLAKFLKLIQTEFFQVLSRLGTQQTLNVDSTLVYVEITSRRRST